MVTKPPASRTARRIFVIAFLATSAAGGLCGQFASPSYNILAECIGGQTLDPETGICPNDAPIGNGVANDAPLLNGADELATNPAVQGAEQGDMADDSLGDGRG